MQGCSPRRFVFKGTRGRLPLVFLFTSQIQNESSTKSNYFSKLETETTTTSFPGGEVVIPPLIVSFWGVIGVVGALLVKVGVSVMGASFGRVLGGVEFHGRFRAVEALLVSPGRS